MALDSDALPALPPVMACYTTQTEVKLQWERFPRLDILRIANYADR